MKVSALSSALFCFQAKEACDGVKARAPSSEGVSYSLVSDSGPYAGMITCRMQHPLGFWSRAICEGQYGSDWHAECKLECKNNGKDVVDCVRG
ncbi:uncharacterized protein CLUP02_01861 [Colletotrichum lupini]|uniref:Uncharacterized protein n=1 Tax=Colletotrichum lupini TaxID=145971 RepID=A0A9Q8SDQ0_9PEZI|nr:uncharacterized protein CLUP02_01861 [Colletotrichum lupini]UQC75208.1 hypothetical protein CLUP02_01861 [Colletotrichum lupini]